MRGLLETKRYWIPCAGACACFIASSWVSPFVAWLLIMLAIGLLFDACTAWFSKAGGTGGIRDYKQ